MQVLGLIFSERARDRPFKSLYYFPFVSVTSLSPRPLPTWHPQSTARTSPPFVLLHPLTSLSFARHELGPATRNTQNKGQFRPLPHCVSL